MLDSFDASWLYIGNLLCSLGKHNVDNLDRSCFVSLFIFCLYRDLEESFIFFKVVEPFPV